MNWLLLGRNVPYVTIFKACDLFVNMWNNWTIFTGILVAIYFDEFWRHFWVLPLWKSKIWKVSTENVVEKSTKNAFLVHADLRYFRLVPLAMLPVEHSSSPSVFSGVHVAQILLLCVVFCRSLFVFFSQLYCLFFDLYGFWLPFWYLQIFLALSWTFFKFIFRDVLDQYHMSPIPSLPQDQKY